MLAFRKNRRIVRDIDDQKPKQNILTVEVLTVRAITILACSAVAISGLSIVGCATIVNDPNIPIGFSFSDGSSGKCTFKNKRGEWESGIPTGGVMIRRSDDALVYDCETADGRKATGSIRSEIESEKIGASVLFLDLGITDAITDKHRTYDGNVVIPIAPREPE